MRSATASAQVARLPWAPVALTSHHTRIGRLALTLALASPAPSPAPSPSPLLSPSSRVCGTA
eukprot:3966908-Prymnesium_polylepis.1